MATIIKETKPVRLVLKYGVYSLYEKNHYKIFNIPYWKLLLKTRSQIEITQLLNFICDLNKMLE